MKHTFPSTYSVLGLMVLLGFLTMGCGRVLPFVMILPSSSALADWVKIEHRLETIQPGPGHVLHIRVLDPAEDVYVRVDWPLWMLKLAGNVTVQSADFSEIEGCDQTCRKALENLPWQALTMRGTSVLVYTAEEKVAIWVD